METYIYSLEAKISNFYIVNKYNIQNQVKTLLLNFNLIYVRVV